VIGITPEIRASFGSDTALHIRDVSGVIFFHQFPLNDRKTCNITQKSIKYNTGKDLNLRPSAIPFTIYLCLFLLPTRTDAMRSSGTGTGGKLSISAKTPSAFQLFRQFHLPPLEKDNFRLYSIYRTVCAFLPAVASLSVKYTVCPTFSGILIKNF